MQLVFSPFLFLIDSGGQLFYNLKEICLCGEQGSVFFHQSISFILFPAGEYK